MKRESARLPLLCFVKLLSGIHDRGELLGNQRSTTDQTAVDVGLSQQLCGVGVVHGATVLDGGGLGNLVAVNVVVYVGFADGNVIANDIFVVLFLLVLTNTYFLIF